MKVEALYVCHFRGLSSQHIHFETGINEIVGDNAEGKTSLLEAIQMLILGGSFRTHQLSDLVQHGEDGFFLEAELCNEGVRKTVSLSYDGSRRKVILDGQQQDSSSSLLGNILGVASSLEDQELIFGPPSVRRRFLDEQIVQVYPQYAKVLSRYKRALISRNLLLKRAELFAIEAWEEQLAILGEQIVLHRRETVQMLAPKVVEVYKYLFPNRDSNFSMKYTTACPGEGGAKWYREQYRARREQELKIKTTLVGPHRDDVEWTLENKNIKSVASQGQARSVALALRFAEWKLLAERSYSAPIFLMDDADSTLDPLRRELVVKFCSEFPQVFITSHTQSSGISLFVKGGMVTSQSHVESNV